MRPSTGQGAEAVAGNRGDARSWLELFRVRYAQEAVGLEWWREHGKTEWTIQLPIVDVAQLDELDLALIEQDDCPTVRVVHPSVCVVCGVV
jgi:hypothetical protein